jgi:hypothetical protein
LQLLHEPDPKIFIEFEFYIKRITWMCGSLTSTRFPSTRVVGLGFFVLPAEVDLAKITKTRKTHTVKVFISNLTIKMAC